MHPFTARNVNAFTERKVQEARALYVAMCKGKVAQRSIHRKPVIGQGFAYHAHTDV